jgi:hypothetical protein
MILASGPRPVGFPLAFFAVLVAISVPASAGPPPAAGGTLSWKGYDWNVTTGGMAGVCEGDPSNVSVDASGYLHLKITKNGVTWTAGELYSATNLGFGTYQWQVSGPIDRMDHTVVLGLSPYGPAAGVGTDGFNEIDTEFSYWNDELGHVNMDWGVYPATSAGKHAEKDFFFSLSGGSSTTTRMVWSSTRIVSTVMSGFEAIGSTSNELSTYTYAPSDAADEIPQQPIPVLLNLWCYEAVPSSGNDVEIILQDFQFIPEGQPIPDAGPPENSDDAGVLDAGSSMAADGGAGSVDATVPGNGTGGGGAGSDSGIAIVTEDASALSPGSGADDAGNAAQGAESSPRNGAGGCSAHGAPSPLGGSAPAAALSVLLGLAIGRRKAKR